MDLAAARTCSVVAVLALSVAFDRGPEAARPPSGRQSPAGATAGAVAITNVTVIDVSSGAKQAAVTVVTKGGEIAAVGRGIPLPSGAVRVDGAGRFLIPGPHADYATDSLLELTRKNVEVSKLYERALSLIRALSRTSLTVVRDMLPRGNGFLAGCDGSVPGFCLHDELQLLTEAGLSPLQAIQAATINPARLLGREETQGSIAAGKRADLLLLEADPVADIANIRRVAAVVVRGRLLSKTDIDRMIASRRRPGR